MEFQRVFTFCDIPVPLVFNEFSKLSSSSVLLDCTNYQAMLNYLVWYLDESNLSWFSCKFLFKELNSFCIFLGRGNISHAFVTQPLSRYYI